MCGPDPGAEAAFERALEVTARCLEAEPETRGEVESSLGFLRDVIDEAPEGHMTRRGSWSRKLGELLGDPVP